MEIIQIHLYIKHVYTPICVHCIYLYFIGATPANLYVDSLILDTNLFGGCRIASEKRMVLPQALLPLPTA